MQVCLREIKIATNRNKKMDTTSAKIWKAEYALKTLNQVYRGEKRGREEESILEESSCLKSVYEFLQSKRSLDINFYKMPSYRCSRCQVDTNTRSTCTQKIESAMGGNYGGVVCPYHKICHDCWWYPDPEQFLICQPVTYKKGVRSKEEADTIDIPLWRGPFNGMSIKCPGCRNNMEMHLEKAIDLYKVYENNKSKTIVEILDESDDTLVQASPGEEDPPIVTESADKTPIHIVINTAHDNNIHVIMSNDETFKRIYEMVAVRLEVGQDSVQLNFDGDVVQKYSTPRMLGMEMGERLDLNTV